VARLTSFFDLLRFMASANRIALKISAIAPAIPV
jgi:hypothetical protein